jgi:hypothetical protein
MAEQRSRITLEPESRSFNDGAAHCRKSDLAKVIGRSQAALWGYQLLAINHHRPGISDRRIETPCDRHAKKGEEKRRPTRESMSVLRPKLCSH